MGHSGVSEAGLEETPRRAYMEMTRKRSEDPMGAQKGAERPAGETPRCASDHVIVLSRCVGAAFPGGCGFGR